MEDNIWYYDYTILFIISENQNYEHIHVNK